MMDEGQPSRGIVTTFFDSTGGISTYVKNVLKYSRSFGIDYIVISPDVSEGCGEGQYAVCSNTKLMIVLKIIWVLRKKDIRYIQCHGSWYLALACCLYKYFRKITGITVRVCFVKHSDINIDRKSIKKVFMQMIDNLSDSVIFVSQYLKEKYSEKFGFIFRKPVYIVNPGCDDAQIDSAVVEKLRKSLKASTRAPLLTYIGLFEYPGKVEGLVLLLKAVQKLRPRFPDVHLAIAGKGTYKDRIVGAVDDLGLCDQVTIFEDIDNPYNLLALSQLHCHITFQESFGLVVVEALNANVPVVASEFGDMPRIGIEGLTITKFDVDAIVSSIVEVLKNPPSVDVKGLREKYNWKANALLLNRITEGAE